MAIKKKAARRPYERRKESIADIKAHITTAVKEILTEEDEAGNRRLPGFKFPPPAAAEEKLIHNQSELDSTLQQSSENTRKRSPEETFGYILTLIRHYSPEEQNFILQNVIKEMAYDRDNNAHATTADAERAKGNLSQFIDITTQVSKAAIDQKKNRV